MFTLRLLSLSLFLLSFSQYGHAASEGPYFDGKSYVVSDVTPADKDSHGWPILHFVSKVPEACAGNATGTAKDGSEVTFTVLGHDIAVTTEAGTGWGNTLIAYAYDFDAKEVGETLDSFLHGLKGQPLELSFACFQSPTVAKAPNRITSASPKVIAALHRQIVTVTLETSIPVSMGMLTLVDDQGTTMAFSLDPAYHSTAPNNFDLNFYWGTHGELAIQNISVGEYLKQKGESVDDFVKRIAGKSVKVSLDYFKDPNPPRD